MVECPPHLIRLVICSTVALLCSAPASHAQRLPLTTYTTAHGLAGNDVAAAVEDARGFLWIGTERGLSRFDGKEFRTFSKERGLADERVTSLVIGADDVLWVGAASGVYRFDLRAGGVFVPITVDGRRARWQHTSLALDRDGGLWCGADGLYQLERAGDGSPVLRRVRLPPDTSLAYVSAVAADSAGNVWAAADRLFRRRPDGRVQKIGGTEDTPAEISFLSADPRGRMWITARHGLFVVEGCGPESPDACRIRRALEYEVVPWKGPVWKPDGGFWIGTGTGVLEVDANDRVLRRVLREPEVPGRKPAPILLDRRGDLWMAIGFTALQRLAAGGLTAFGRAEGLEAGGINSIFRTQAGELVVIGHPHVVQRLDGDRFIVTRPLMPRAVRDPGWGWYQIDLQDRFGHWWISTHDGIVHWPALRHPEDLARTRPMELLTTRGCFVGLAVFRLYEDSHADLWIGTIATNQPSLHRLRRATGTIDCFSTASFLRREAAPTAFLDDGRGTLWIGFYEGQIVRYRGGRFVCVFDCEDPSQGNITALTLDRRRRLWIATNRAGVLRIDDIAAEHPTAVRLTTNEGLTSNRTRAVLEDRFGRIYIGTDQGVDVLEPDSGRMRHYGVDDGLPHPFINMAQADPNGDLWFGTLNGLARLHPAPIGPAVTPSRVLIDGLRVAGEPREVAASGAREITGIVLAPDQRNLEIDFVALPRDAARTLRFQYRLSDDEPWSPPSSNRSVVLAGLSAGRHRLQIRALEGREQASPEIAAVSFQVLAPVYRRGWFLALAALAAFGLASIAYRSRVAHVMALERQRTRIAMDLHDEMGSRLGSIGLLADLAAEETATGTPLRSRLEHIAENAAGMGSSLADIVWSLRHSAMTLEAVARHLAVHGHRLFPGPAPAFDARFPEQWPAVDLSPAVGRAVLMIGLEALHNCARHAKAASATLDLHAIGRDWVLSVSDDGRGFPPDAASGSGFGLHTRPGRGTTVRLTFNRRGRNVRAHRMIIREIWTRVRRIS
jgi:ligand-binding sensor domain-containing protein